MSTAVVPKFPSGGGGGTEPGGPGGGGGGGAGGPELGGKGGGAGGTELGGGGGGGGAELDDDSEEDESCAVLGLESEGGGLVSVCDVGDVDDEVATLALTT